MATNSDSATPPTVRRMRPLPSIIFASRWLQLPLYLGLIVAQVAIHLTFLLSALAVAGSDRIMTATAHAKGEHA
jgi:uncharacterized membrane protein YqhA